MQRCGISVCVIPHADMHQNEYISKSDAYLEFYSGFTGSAGTLVVTLDFIGLWTDGRYAIQAKQEIKNTPIHLFVEGVDGVVDFFTWIEQCIIEGNILGIDASLFSYNHYTKICKLCKKRNVELNLSFQPIDELWINRPKAAFQLPFILDQHFVGEYVESKLKRVRDKMSLLGATSYLLSALDEIAWLLNCRGSDIAYNPVFKAYMLITHDQCVVFLNRKVCNALLFSYFSSYGVMVYDYEFILSYLQSIRNANVLFDGTMVNAAMIEALDASNKKINVSSPIAQLKAIKNEVEIEGCRRAMRKDGVVWVKLWQWIETELALSNTLSEDLIAKKITQLKEKQEEFVCESFKSIVAFAQNAAICHYAISSNQLVRKESLLLVDTGTHYLHGTTDTTRVIGLGELSSMQKKEVTLVLKGHIALAQAVFLKGTKGFQLDALARQFLWKDGYDYAHGTGHGIGHCLNVHEGYASISPRAVQVALQPGMLITNEPGLYKENEYGMRIENVMLVKEVGNDGRSGRFLCFETLTLCPIDMQIIDKTMLTEEELIWLEQYQQKVFDELSPYLTEEERVWLKNKITN